MANTGTDTNTRSTKRRRTAPDTLHICDLPDALLANVAIYLPKPSIALFAVAMTTPPTSLSSWQLSTASKAILSLSSATPPSIHRRDNEESIGEQWEVLDFGEIDKSLASKLTDDTVGGMLRGIDAVNNLKILKLAGCVNISGGGLEHLRGSEVLEQIDLSLVGQHECPDIEPEPMISETAVLPIFDSIINARGNSLRHIQLSRKWRTEKSTVLHRFLGRYDNFLENCRLKCWKCERICQETSHIQCVEQSRDAHRYGLQSFVCYECRQYFCDHDDCLEDGPVLWPCSLCDKEYCSDCVALGCGDCEICVECLAKCDRCRRSTCAHCDLTYWKCKDCEKAHCQDCWDGEEFDVVGCGTCGADYCFDCRYSECVSNPDAACDGCFETIGFSIEEIEELRRENMGKMKDAERRVNPG